MAVRRAALGIALACSILGGTAAAQEAAPLPPLPPLPPPPPPAFVGKNEPPPDVILKDAWGRPTIVAYEAGRPIPLGYHYDRQRSLPLFITGFTSLFVPYLLGLYALGYGKTSDPAQTWTLLPAAGPFFAAATVRASTPGADVLRGVFITDGALQTTGLGLLILSTFVTHPVMLLDEAYPKGKTIPFGKRLTPAFAFAPGNAFLSCAVRF